MSNILISWVATVNDFYNGRMPVNSSGPNCSVHHFYWKYDHHILLSSSKAVKEDVKLLQLASYLRKTFSHSIEARAMAINDVIDINEIYGKISYLLLSFRKDDVDIFISPGTPTMQVAWYLAHQRLSLRTRLFQLRKSEHTPDNSTPEQVWVNMEQSKIPTALIIREELKDSKNNNALLITKSLQPVYNMARKVAAADKVTVLIYGETGTGKEGLARYIHAHSPRSKGPFIAVNCASMGDSLLESRLFGHVKGSFSGAETDRDGYFSSAEGGSIFLDEIGDISPYMQQALLRVLQEKEITRVGDTKSNKINLRVIAATNQDLVKLCAEGKFRWDLYYRLTVVDLTLPSFQQMESEEVEEIFEFMMNKKSADFKLPIPKISDVVRKRILGYSFPGNMREVENFVERLFAMVEDEVGLDILPSRFLNGSNVPSLNLDDVISQHVNKVFLMCNRNISKTAKVLGRSTNTVKSKLNQSNKS